jgi:hypothetical protein
MDGLERCRYDPGMLGVLVDVLGRLAGGYLAIKSYWSGLSARMEGSGGPSALESLLGLVYDMARIRAEEEALQTGYDQKVSSPRADVICHDFVMATRSTSVSQLLKSALSDEVRAQELLPETTLPLCKRWSESGCSRLRESFERVLQDPAARGTPVLWKAYMAFEIAMERFQEAKRCVTGLGLLHKQH